MVGLLISNAYHICCSSIPHHRYSLNLITGVLANKHIIDVSPKKVIIVGEATRSPERESMCLLADTPVMRFSEYL